MKLLLTSSFANNKDSLSGLISKPYEEINVAFITTAANPYTGSDLWWVKKDRDALKKLGVNLNEIDIAQIQGKELKKRLMEKDLIFVTGGNTVYLLEQAQKSGFMDIVKDLVENDVVYAASSAGSILAGPSVELERNSDERENPPELESYDGLGFVNFIIQPHWGSDELKEEYMSYIKQIYSSEHPILTLNDTQAILVNGKNLKIIAP